MDFDKVDRNPCKRVERFVLRNKRARYFTYEEEERLMNVLTGSLAHIRPVVIVGIGTGLRPPSEIFNLKINDVDFERNVIRAGTKTNEEGEIPMGKEVREVLLELRDRKTDSEYLFVSYRTGKRFKEIKNGFRKALKLAGIKGACLYTMRHTFGTRLASQGYNAYEIMQLMRHRDIKTSVRYCHTTDGRKRQAVESIWEKSPHKIPTKVDQPATGL
jgi:integrase